MGAVSICIFIDALMQIGYKHKGHLLFLEVTQQREKEKEEEVGEGETENEEIWPEKAR